MHIVRLLDRSGDRQLRAVAGILGDLRGKRNDADYRLNNAQVEKKATALAVVETAAGLFTDIETLMSDEVRKIAIVGVLRNCYSEITGKPLN